MVSVKKEGKKDGHQCSLGYDQTPNNECILDGKRLYDLYRHTTKLIE